MAILYRYKCNYCQEELEVRQSITEDSLQMCPECGTPNLERVITGGADLIIQQEPKTLGVLADRNHKKNGRFWREDKEQEARQSRKKAKKFVGKLKEGASPLKRDVNYKPWWRPKENLTTELANLTPEQKKKYIQTGRKPPKKDD